MRCGLFGKLPSKRDFIALSTPREFLSPWEAWIQGGISASRTKLGEGWQEAFLHAPIWRFWLGADICGRTAAGAFMPSVDGVGRYFPLSVFACAEPGEAIPPPELDPQEAWFSALEDFLLSSLHAEATFEAVSAAFQGLARPSDRLAAPSPDDVVQLPEGTVVASVSPGALQATLTAVRLADYPRAYAGSSFWWTIGGESFPALAVVGRRLPDPYLFTGMLTGSFDTVFQ